MRPLHSPLLTEALIAAILLAVLGSLSLSGWTLYRQSIMPAAHSVPTLTPTAVVEEAVARKQAQVLRQVLDNIGAGIAARQSGKRDEAVTLFQKALALDPTNADARANLRELGVEPPAAPAPTATPLPLAAPAPARA